MPAQLPGPPLCQPLPASPNPSPASSPRPLPPSQLDAAARGRGEAEARLSALYSEEVLPLKEIESQFRALYTEKYLPLKAAAAASAAEAGAAGRAAAGLRERLVAEELKVGGGREGRQEREGEMELCCRRCCCISIARAV